LGSLPRYDFSDYGEGDSQLSQSPHEQLVGFRKPKQRSCSN
jgi:hypothetical protein